MAAQISDLFRSKTNALLGGAVSVVSAIVLTTAVVTNIGGAGATGDDSATAASQSTASKAQEAAAEDGAQSSAAPELVALERTVDSVRSELPEGRSIDEPWEPGTQREVTFEVDPHVDGHGVPAEGELRTRDAYVHVGNNYDPQRPTPIVFGFGGWRDNPENFMSYAHLDESPMNDEAIVVYPRGIEDAWEGAPYSATKSGEDVAYFKRMVADIAASMNVDLTRIYAVGISNGGGMATTLACRAPGVLASFVSISGAYYGPTLDGCGAPDDPDRGAAADQAGRDGNQAFMTPGLLIHGDADSLTDYDGGLLHGVPFYGVPETLRRLAGENQCREVPEERDLNGTEYPAADAVEPGKVTEFRFLECGAPLTLWKVHGENHGWYYAPDTAAVAWDFFTNRS